jgi:hypothetical protein
VFELRAGNTRSYDDQDDEEKRSNCNSGQPDGCRYPGFRQIFRRIHLQLTWANCAIIDAVRTKTILFIEIKGNAGTGEHVVKLKVIAATLLVGALLAAQADSAPLTGHGRRSEARAIPRDRNSVCIVDVLHSEELPFAPLFYHRLRATLRITPPGGPPFETTVEKLISWQAPPFRQGQRLRLWCDPASPWPAWAG